MTLILPYYSINLVISFTDKLNNSRLLKKEKRKKNDERLCERSGAIRSDSLQRAVIPITDAQIQFLYRPLRMYDEQLSILVFTNKHKIAISTVAQ